MLDCNVFLEACDGADALKKLRKTKHLPNFIFLIVNMPRMDGKECFKELKKDARPKSIPVIMHSTSFCKKSIEEFRLLGSSHYLLKPTDIKKLPKEILIAIKKAF